MARVIKLAQPGYDVFTAGDENLIYSSQWPLLPIYKQGSFVIPDVTQRTTIINHNLGFVPAFWFFTNTTVEAWSGGFGGVLQDDSRSEFFGPTGGGHIGINENTLQFVPTAFTETGSLRIYYYIFTIDITKLFIAPITNVGAISSGGGNRVFKLAKPTKDVSSDSLKDYVIHSDCRSPLIHSVIPGIGNLVATHNLGYNPMFFAYIQDYSNTEPGFYEMAFSGSGGSDVLVSDFNTVSYRTAGVGLSRNISIVTLKDPFLVNYTRSVVV